MKIIIIILLNLVWFLLVRHIGFRLQKASTATLIKIIAATIPVFLFVPRFINLYSARPDYIQELKITLGYLYTLVFLAVLLFGRIKNFLLSAPAIERSD